MLWDAENRQRYQTANGYTLVYLPEHPSAHNGTILMHRVVAENALGRPLAAGEIVHHKNGDKTDNRADNLEVMTKSAHSMHHASAMTILGESIIEATCPQCSDVFGRVKRNANRGERMFCSRSCSSRFNATGKTREIPHGKYGRYRKGCRCRLCKSANTDRVRKYRSAPRKS